MANHALHLQAVVPDMFFSTWEDHSRKPRAQHQSYAAVAKRGFSFAEIDRWFLLCARCIRAPGLSAFAPTSFRLPALCTKLPGCVFLCT